ncbi:MAG: response regulator [Candidatus Dormibacteraeota bacterium]|nr:response regulator [Candidatus Dormibacteraeota bacterium]
MSRIVLIEDDEPIAELLSMNLEAAGYQVAIARDGVSGLRLVRASAPDLILLDVMLPGMGGIEVCRRVRRGSGPPVILLSAGDAEGERAVGLDAGAADYITKPFSIRDLLSRVAEVLHRTSDRAHEESSLPNRTY